jgi:hypothetical protein
MNEILYLIKDEYVYVIVTPYNYLIFKTTKFKEESAKSSLNKLLINFLPLVVILVGKYTDTPMCMDVHLYHALLQLPFYIFIIVKLRLDNINLKINFFLFINFFLLKYSLSENNTTFFY